MSHPQLWGRWREASRLVLLEVFEDSATGTRIKEFRQDFARQLGDSCQLIEHVWLFNLFRFHELREIAAEEAAAADLIVISVHKAESLSDEAKSWMDGWLERETQRDALVLVLQDTTREAKPGAVEEYLREATKRSGVQFAVEIRAMAE